MLTLHMILSGFNGLCGSLKIICTVSVFYGPFYNPIRGFNTFFCEMIEHNDLKLNWNWNVELNLIYLGQWAMVSHSQL